MIYSDRLKIIPLTEIQLAKYLNSISDLENELKLVHAEIDLSPDLKEAFESSILPNSKDSNEDRLYYTLWIIIDKKLNIITGGVLFTGPPNENGEIEIGYGINPEFQKMGYATEMVQLMCSWAFGQKNIKSITAKTDSGNFPSHKTLLKNQFVKVSQDETGWLWKKEKTVERKKTRHHKF